MINKTSTLPTTKKKVNTSQLAVNKVQHFDKIIDSILQIHLDLRKSLVAQESEEKGRL